MSKKDYIIKLLTALQDEWPIAKGLLVLISQNKVDDETIDALSEVFMRAVDKISHKINNEKIKKGAQALQKIKKLEEDQDNKEEIQELEDLIEQL